MSTEKSPGDVSPDKFAEVGDKVADAASGDGGGVGFMSRVGDMVSPDATDAIKYGRRLFKQRGDGMTVEQVKEEYGVPDHVAYIVRGVTRMVGVSDAPPIADVLIGVAKWYRGVRA